MLTRLIHMYKKLHIIPLIFLVLSGCTASLVKPINSGSKYAPVNEQAGIGEIIYNLDGADFLVKARREDAYKSMFSQCKGKYEIVKEWTYSEQQAIGLAQASQSYGQSIMFAGQINNRHISFKCVAEQ